MRFGNVLMVVGGALVLIGALVRLGLLSWFGNLPGDIRIESDSSRVFIPITSMIVASVALTLLVNVAGSFFRGR